ncbi:hypothetical protein RND71_031287 [Anisodus tanguticus]|uniref:RING-type domain-containing protein n=1 Tax=Anisodus tanguticus TaxID=243964 RepID=A0AAE1UYR4_9SOLA|nr:hypothetical protein RND71_031287 [Anisodus tanguticus]
MAKIREIADGKSLRLFLWNEKLTKNQISQSEGLCVFIVNSTFITLQPSEYTSTTEERNCSTVIPFDISKLLNKDVSLGQMLVSATLQFLPQTIKKLGDYISYCLFTEFEDSQALLPSPRPTYVIAIEISQTRYINFDDNVSRNFTGLPPPLPFYRRFEIQKVFTVHNVSVVDYMNDPYDNYTEDVIEYLKALREYTGEGGIFPTKPPIAMDVPRGFFEVQPCITPIDDFLDNRSLNDLIDETCPVCQDEFKDENEVIATYCSHTFHTRQYRDKVCST